MADVPQISGFKFDARRLAVAQALARGMVVSEISRQLDIPERTIRDWQSRGEMQARVYEEQLKLNGEMANAVADELLGFLSYIIGVVRSKLPNMQMDSVEDVQRLVEIAGEVAEMRSKVVGKQASFQPTTMNQMNVLMAGGEKLPDIAKILDNVQAGSEVKAELRDQFDAMMEQIAEAGDDEDGQEAES